MIKGINRQVVEVRETGCEYFEKIMFFVKPEYISVSEGEIREQAGKIASGAGMPPITKVKKPKAFEVMKLAAVFLLGVVAAAVTVGLLK